MSGRRPWQAVCAVAAMVSVLGGFAASTALAAADEQGNKKPAKAEKDNKGRDHDTNIVVTIDLDGHRKVVREYVTRGSLPPGLAKREALPPGLSKQLREKGTLPPGLRAHLVPVPSAWNSRLPGIPVYYTRYFVGRDLIIIDTRNDLIVSLIRDLLD